MPPDSNQIPQTPQQPPAPQPAVPVSPASQAGPGTNSDIPAPQPIQSDPMPAPQPQHSAFDLGQPAQSPSQVSGQPAVPRGDPTQPPISSPVDTNLMPSPPKKKKTLMIVVIIAAVLLVAGGIGLYLYLDYLNNKPEKVLSDALTNTLTDVLDKKPITSLSSLAVESKNASSPYSAQIILDAKTANSNSESAATLELKSGTINVNLKGALITIDSTEAYVKFDNLVATSKSLYASNPELRPMLKQYVPLFDKIDRRWIKLDSSALSQSGVVQSQDQANACTKAIGNLRISKADKPKINKIYSQNQFITTVKVLPKENIDGENSFHYQISFDQEKAIGFVKGVIELPSFAEVKSSCSIKQSDLDQEEKALKESGAKANNSNQPKPTVELWVGEKTRLPTKVKVGVNDTDFSATFNSNIKIDAKNVQIIAPTDYLQYGDIQKLLQQSFSTFSSKQFMDIAKPKVQKF